MQVKWRVTPSVVLGVIFGGAAILAYPGFVRWLTDTGGSGGRLVVTNAPSIVAEGAQSIVVRDARGRKAWEFSAKRITLSPDRLYYTVTEVQRGILYRNGKPFLKLKAHQVRLNQQTRDLEATGTVSASGPDGLTVRSERADWKHQVQRLTCPDDVHASIRGLKIDTRAAYYEAKTGKLHCPQTVMIKSERATLQGANAVADTKTRRVEFNQAVHLAITPR